MKIPLIGLGTWQLNGKICQKAVTLALEIGYRHIDTAHLYDNHREIGVAIRDFPREELFITSKFVIRQLAFESVMESYERALDELQTDYLDLYLLHAPDDGIPLEKILEELEELKKKKLVRQVGVSNFSVRHLKECKIRPACNQVEFHPYLNQKALLEYCNKHGIQLISYRSLGKGELLADPLVNEIAQLRKMTPAQVLLRWCVQKGIGVIPKASSRQHLEENFAVIDQSLTKEDMEKLDHISEQVRFCQISGVNFDV